MNIDSPHHWPAEWEPQAATWLAWPHNRDTWPGHYEPVPNQYKAFVSAIASVQPVHVLAGPSSASPSADAVLGRIPNVTIHQLATNDSWIRDYGPTFVRRVDDGSLVGVDWKFNAWGGKYPPFDLDADAARQICMKLPCPRSCSTLYCEGGALETDGRKTLLTTSSCLRSPLRNPGWTRSMVEQELMRQLGISKTIWVDGGGLLGDDTDGHIDQLARFVKPNVVVAATSSVPSDPNRDGLEKNVRILQEASDAHGKPFEVHSLPTPPPRFIDDARVPESYCNFLFAGGIVVLPTFRSPSTDAHAIDLLQGLLPTHRVVPLDAYDIAWGLGAFHCLSQQQPATN